MNEAWWFLLGAFFFFEASIYLGAWGQDGGVMPWQPFAMVVGGVLGLAFFLLTHVVIRKYSKEKDE